MRRLTFTLRLRNWSRVGKCDAHQLAYRRYIGSDSDAMPAVYALTDISHWQNATVAIVRQPNAKWNEQSRTAL